MAFSVVMPALEMAQETGKLIAWRKKEGDRVAKGEPLLEIETDKAVVEVEAPADGVLVGIKAAEGAEIPVGQTIAWIVAPGETPPAESHAAPAARAGSHPRATVSAPVPAGVAPSAAAHVKISPKARRLAKELGVDIANLRGSGPDGEVLASDVQATSTAHVRTAASGSSGGPELSGAAQPAGSEAGDLLIPATIGRIMAERTTQSWTTVPHFFVTREVDAVALNQYRDTTLSQMGTQVDPAKNVRITHTDLLVALVARVLLQHPRLNASWTPNGIRQHNNVNIGVAIAVDEGVVTVVVRNAHRASLPEIAIQRRDVAQRARSGKLRPADIADATFTISNLGMYQVDRFTAIITPPQAAVLAVGAISDRVAAVAGKPLVRPMMTLTLSCDHRVADGARAALFLRDLAEVLLDPAKLLK